MKGSDDIEMWHLEECGNAVLLRAHASSDGNKFLSCDKDGNLVTTVSEKESSAEDRCWRLEPWLPSYSLNRRQIGAVVAAGAATVALPLAAPLAIMGAISSIGFSTAGI